MKKYIFAFIVISLIAVVSSLEIQLSNPGQQTNRIINLNTDSTVIGTLLGLTDTPSTYAGSGGNCLKVNAGATAVEFVSCGGGGDFSFTDFQSSFDLNITGFSGGNSSWNQSLAETLYADIQWDYNQSDGSFNATYDAHTQGNLSWNQSLADTLYQTIGGSAGLFELNGDWITNTTTSGINTSGLILQGQQFTPQNMFDFNFWDDGSNLILNSSSVTGNNYFGIETEGGFFQLYANPNAGNDYLLATISETQGASTEINFYEGGTGHNRLWSSGSVRIGGNADNLCSDITSNVDCDTPGTGADLIVEDDIWAGGQVIAESVNVTGNITTNDRICLNAGCTKFIWDNSTDVVIQG